MEEALRREQDRRRRSIEERRAFDPSPFTLPPELEGAPLPYLRRWLRIKQLERRMAELQGQLLNTRRHS